MDVFRDPASTRIQELCRDSIYRNGLLLIAFTKGLYSVPAIAPYLMTRYRRTGLSYEPSRLVRSGDSDELSKRPRSNDPHRSTKGDWRELSYEEIIDKIDVPAFKPLIAEEPLAAFTLSDAMARSKKFDGALSKIAAAVTARKPKTFPGPTSIYIPDELTFQAIDYGTKAKGLPIGSIPFADEHQIAHSLLPQQLGLTPNKADVERQAIESFRAESLASGVAAIERSVVTSRLNYGAVCVKRIQKGLAAFLDFIYNVEFVYASSDNPELLKNSIKAARERLNSRDVRPPLLVNVVTTSWHLQMKVMGHLRTKVLKVSNKPRVEVW